LKYFPGRRSSSIRQHDSVAATALRLLKRAQCGQARGPDRREDPDQWWRTATSARANIDATLALASAIEHLAEAQNNLVLEMIERR
jgi:hypothetical protein